jgi:hypothetical protein
LYVGKQKREKEKGREGGRKEGKGRGEKGRFS